jgi:hypothetical protein
MNPRPKWAWICLLILQVIQSFSLFPWMLMAGLSVMAFDAPGSSQMWQPWAFVLAVWSYPLWLLLAGGASWALIYFRKPVAAVLLGLIFTLPMPTLLLVMFLGNS